jgi:hypothetical protein
MPSSAWKKLQYGKLPERLPEKARLETQPHSNPFGAEMNHCASWRAGYRTALLVR